MSDALPTITYPPELPVSAAREELARAISREPGRDRRGRDRVGQDDAAAEDLPRARPREDRPHPAAAHRRPQHRRAHRRGARRRARRARRLPGALRRPVAGRDPHQADDRRRAARRAAPRPRPAPLRHDHPRRGARAVAHHRLPARLPQAAAAAPPRPEAHHHVARRSTRESFAAHFAVPTAPPDRRGERAHLPGRDPVPAAGVRAVRRRRGRRRPTTATTSRASPTRSPSSSREPAGRRAGLPVRRERDPGCRGRRARRVRPRDRGGPPLRAAERGRPAPGVRDETHPRHPASRRAGDQRRRDEPHRARHQVRGRCRHRPHLALQHAGEGAAAADRGDQPGEREPALRVARGARATGSRSGCTRRRTSTGRAEFTDPEILRTELWRPSSCR